MPSQQDISTNAARPNSLVGTLVTFLEANLDELVDRSIEIAKTNGYAPFTTTIRAAWVGAIHSLTHGIGSFMLNEQEGPAGPLAVHDYGKDDRFIEMRKIARQHRSLGITLEMYLGLLKHFKNLYLEILEEFESDEDFLVYARISIRDFYDETELSVISDWKLSDVPQRFRELQERTRTLTLEKDRYFAIFESLRNPAFLLDHNKKLVNANHAATELFMEDAEAGDIIYLRSLRRKTSKLQSELDYLLSLDLDSNQTLWLETLQGKLYFDVRIRALHDAVKNIPLGFVLLLNDVTAHQLAVDKAQRAEKQMSRFLATMSHEIRTPLHNVLGATDLLRTSQQNENANYLDVIEIAGKTLLQTLTNVLDYSKIENSPPIPRPKPTKIRQVLDTFHRLTSLGDSDNDGQVSIDISDAISDYVELDWAMVQQVLTNLVANALRVDTGEGVRISLSLSENKNVTPNLRFQVHDHGPGISEQDAKALFQPFDQINARNTGSGGAGLGLAISHHLVEAMDGLIGYQNKDRRTIVWFEVPYLVANEPSEKDTLELNQINPPKLYSPNPTKCLLVDDDPAGTIITTAQLERLGCSVDIANTISEAEQRSSQEDYDVYIVDYLLPDGVGSTLVQSLKDQGLENSRFIALTANAEVIKEWDEQHKCFEAILSKPVTQETLGSALLGSPSVSPADFHLSTQPKTSLTKEFSSQTLNALVDTFEAQWDEFRALLNKSKTTGLNDELALFAHRLSGTTAMLELYDLEVPLKALKSACANKDFGEDTIELMEQLDKELMNFPSWQDFKQVLVEL